MIVWCRFRSVSGLAVCVMDVTWVLVRRFGVWSGSDVQASQGGWTLLGRRTCVVWWVFVNGVGEMRTERLRGMVWCGSDHRLGRRIWGGNCAVVVKRKCRSL